MTHEDPHMASTAARLLPCRRLHPLHSSQQIKIHTSAPRQYLGPSAGGLLTTHKRFYDAVTEVLLRLGQSGNYCTFAQTSYRLVRLCTSKTVRNVSNDTSADTLRKEDTILKYVTIRLTLTSTRLSIPV